MNIFIRLFLTFFKIGAFSFGGGYAMLPFISKEAITNNNWISTKEFTDLIAISQATPGPIAINGATYVGYQAGGFYGSMLATLGVVLPSIIIMIIFTKFFIKFKNNKYVENAFLALRPATVGLIAAAAILISKDSFVDYKSVVIFAAAFIASYKYKTDPILLTIIAGVIGAILY